MTFHYIVNSVYMEKEQNLVSLQRKQFHLKIKMFTIYLKSSKKQIKRKQNFRKTQMLGGGGTGL